MTSALLFRPHELGRRRVAPRCAAGLRRPIGAARNLAPLVLRAYLTLLIRTPPSIAATRPIRWNSVTCP
jgi:hypothetical protein